MFQAILQVLCHNNISHKNLIEIELYTLTYTYNFCYCFYIFRFINNVGFVHLRKQCIVLIHKVAIIIDNSNK